MASIHIGGWLLNIFAGVIWLGTSYLSVTLVYECVFHPLARFPGPFWARTLPLCAIYHTYFRDLHRYLHRCHEKYGSFSLDMNFHLMHTMGLISCCRSCCKMLS